MLHTELTSNDVNERKRVVDCNNLLLRTRKWRIKLLNMSEIRHFSWFWNIYVKIWSHRTVREQNGHANVEVKPIIASKSKNIHVWRGRCNLHAFLGFCWFKPMQNESRVSYAILNPCRSVATSTSSCRYLCTMWTSL